MAHNPESLLDIDMVAPRHSYTGPRPFDHPLDFDTSGQLYIDNELILVYGFLNEYIRSENTLISYINVLEKYVQWLYRVQSKSLFTNDIDIATEYIDFILEPPTYWIGDAPRPKYVFDNGTRTRNPLWRPFRRNKDGQYSVSSSAMKSTLAILQSLYNYLIALDKTRINPFAVIKQKKSIIQTNKELPQVLRITNLQWDYTLRAAEAMAVKAPKKHERTLFVISMMRSMFLRVSDLAAYRGAVPSMSDFKRKEEGWVFEATGKGNVSRLVTVSDQMLEALIRYREHLNLAKLPLLTTRRI
jgi:site-specific recombinase XerD